MNVYEIKIEDRKLRLNLVDQIEWFDEFMKITGGVDTLYDEYEIGTLFLNDEKQFIWIDKNNDVFKYDK